MKKSILIILIVLLISSFSLVFADDVIYNEGPEPNNPNFMYFTITRTLNGEPNPITNHYYYYIAPSAPKKYLSENIGYDGKIISSYSFVTLNSSTQHTLYKDGSPEFINNSIPVYAYSYYSTNVFTLDFIRDSLNRKLLKDNYVDKFQINNIFEFKIIKNTIPIRNANNENETVIFPMANGSGNIDDSYIKIISPRNGFIQTGSFPSWSILINYNIKIDDNYNADDWVIKPHSSTNVKGTSVTSHDIKIMGSGINKYCNGTMRATYIMPIGTNKIYFTITNKKTGKEYKSDEFIYYNLQDFVDDDGDGFDDRSGLDKEVGGVPPDWDLNTHPNNNNLGLQDWSFTTFFSNISIIFSKFFLSISELVSNIGNMGEIFKVVTSVIPVEIITMLTASVVIFIILKIFGR